jgi:hypothetical protein
VSECELVSREKHDRMEGAWLDMEIWGMWLFQALAKLYSPSMLKPIYEP